MVDANGNALPGSHLIGMFHRIVRSILHVSFHTTDNSIPYSCVNDLNLSDLSYPICVAPFPTTVEYIANVWHQACRCL